MKNPRFEYLDDVIEDEHGWRRRGDFETEDDFRKGRAPKEGSATVKRWQQDEMNARDARARSQITPPFPPPGGSGMMGGGGSSSGGSSSGSSGGSSS